MASNYTFLRAEMPNLDWLSAAGWDTPLFAANDKRLEQQIAAARQKGMQFGIWADPNWYEGASAEQFAQQMAGLSQKYNPSVVVPDIEFIGKGYQGSEGWQYNQRLADAWRRYLPNVNTAVTVLPNQADFNYEAWKGVANRWLPQAYGQDPKKHVFDPKQIIQTLVSRGVDPSLITPVLGPGHARGYQGDYSLWTADDWLGQELPAAFRGARTTQQSQAVQPVEQEAPGPTNLPPRPDSQNPAAIAYAQKRLAQLRGLGIEVPDAADPTAAWRQASTNITDIARQHGYLNPRDFLASANRPAPDLINRVLADRPEPVRSGPPIGRPGTGVRTPARPVALPHGGRPMPPGLPRGAARIIAGMKGSIVRGQQLPGRPGRRPPINIAQAAKKTVPYRGTRGK